MHRNLRTIRPNIFFDTPILHNCIPEGYMYTTERKKNMKASYMKFLQINLKNNTMVLITDL